MLDILRKRRSIRHYTAEPLSPELLDQLKEAALRSPSSRGLDPWEFIFVTDRDLLAELATAKAHGAHFLRDAALGVVVLGNESLADTWIEDCSIAATILHLTAQSLGLGSCWVQIRLRQDQAGTCAEARVRQTLNIPDTWRVTSIMSIGHPAKAAKPHPRESLKDHKIKAGVYA
jgi:nitroreductase